MTTSAAGITASPKRDGLRPSRKRASSTGCWPMPDRQAFCRGGSRVMELYRALLGLYAAEFREEYGRELCLVLEDRRREQRSRAGLFLVWLHAVWGVLKEAPKERCHVIFQDLRYAVRILRKD